MGTYKILLEMLGREQREICRFFALWEILPRDPKPSEELYHLALEMALESRSARQTIKILEEMLEARVFPSPQLAEKLAIAGRTTIQIHHIVGKFVNLNRKLREKDARRNTDLILTHVDERNLRL